MNSFAHKRQQILQQMEQIQRMERGSVQAESRPSKGHPHQNQGPYYKHQVWKEGQNLSRRVPVDEADSLTSAIAGRKRFEALAQEYVDTTVAMTRAESSIDSKKKVTSKRRSRGKRPA